MKISVVNIRDNWLGPLITMLLAMQGKYELSLVSLNEGFAEKQVTGIQRAYGGKISGGTNYALLKDSGVVIIAGAEKRRPGMRREDLIGINNKIISELLKEIQQNAPDAVVVLASGISDVETLGSIGIKVKRVFRDAVILVSAENESVYESSNKAVVAATKAIKHMG